jgi:enoyl-CoA hydratase/carnithine racemase
MELSLGVRLITLPRRIDARSAAALRRDLQGAVKAPDCDVLLLSGTEGAFCEGMDFAALSAPAAARKAVAAFADCLRTLRNAPKPSLALVDGKALGGGLGLAAACDGVIASNRSLFALPEVLFGLTPAVIAPFLLERMTPRRFELWALTGGSHDAEAARREGLVDEMVPAEEIQQASQRWLRSLSRARPKTIKSLRGLVATASGREALLKKGIAETSRALGDKKIRAALVAFAEHGIPPWESR